MGTIQIMILKTIPLQFCFIVHVFFIALPLVWPTPNYQILKSISGTPSPPTPKNMAPKSIGFTVFFVHLYLYKWRYVGPCLLYYWFSGAPNRRVPRGADSDTIHERLELHSLKLTALRLWKKAGPQKERMGFQPSIFTEFLSKQNYLGFHYLSGWLIGWSMEQGFLSTSKQSLAIRCVNLQNPGEFQWNAHAVYFPQTGNLVGRNPPVGTTLDIDTGVWWN